MRRLLACAVLALLPFFAVPAYAVEHNVHHTLLEEPVRPLPRKLGVLPAQLEVHEISVGGDRPGTTMDTTGERQHPCRIAAHLLRPIRLRGGAPAGADGRGKGLIEQYLASYRVVGSAAHQNTINPEWAHKHRHFDYTTGECLAFLRERAGVDVAMMLVGEDYASSLGARRRWSSAPCWAWPSKAAVPSSPWGWWT